MAAISLCQSDRRHKTRQRVQLAPAGPRPDSVGEKWYEYGENATKDALRAWCEENGLELGFAGAGPRAGPE